MHSIDTRNEFAVLRSQGLSLDKISAKLGVSKATLGRWHYECLHEIQLLRALQWEHLEDELGHRLEDSLKLIAKRIRRLETELDSREPQTFTRTELARVIRGSRLDYLKLRSIVLAPLGPPKKAIALMQAAPEERDEMRQAPEPPNGKPNKTNDSQQRPIPSSHSRNGHPVTPDLRAEPRCATDSNSRGPISRQPFTNPNPQPADAVHDSKSPTFVVPASAGHNANHSGVRSPNSDYSTTPPQDTSGQNPDNSRGFSSPSLQPAPEILVGNGLSDCLPHRPAL